MNHLYRVFLVVLIVVCAFIVWREVQAPPPSPSIPEEQEEIIPPEDPSTAFTSLQGVELVVTSPLQGSVVTSPLTVTGEVPGFWYFEATFPLSLVNWDGLIIAEGYATAQGEWMTEDMVPFTATLEFTDVLPLTEGVEDLSQVQDFMKNGALILQRDNPSGLPENDDAIEIPIRFAE
ncbi:hypothetical protein COV05_03465 [Candidatus Uhrbacteria bacterium CG10_big_fil_rev_8_21_14_0_10_48_16]|uniref:Bacterial spore germination immunoglobulin-like domain-containing protein n=1 Tax=Candidatus Uhrbacteria bacterium CG10_big_fil_rev_8_21_14_0_10_48_16 TaxID=1975038 RepID=A0A2M8LGS1_9BACT|nr:MAG: hypothetical protein COV05_03465 [Candidatus Uhrbacteria bacterium CG10_big_fil_rev_8_21_14_0_10_48_16]